MNFSQWEALRDRLTELVVGFEEIQPLTQNQTCVLRSGTDIIDWGWAVRPNPLGGKLV